MHLNDFLCAFLINVIFRASGSDKKFSNNTLNLQNLSIFMATCGKFLFLWQNVSIFVAKFSYFCGKIWQNLGFQMAIFHDASTKPN